MSICNIIRIAGGVIGLGVAVWAYIAMRKEKEIYKTSNASMLFLRFLTWAMAAAVISICVPIFVEIYEEAALCQIVEHEELLQTVTVESYTVTEDGNYFLIGIEDESDGLTFAKYPLQKVHLYPTPNGQTERMWMEIWTVNEDIVKDTTKSWFRSPNEPPEKERFMRTKSARTEYRIYTQDYEGTSTK